LTTIESTGLVAEIALDGGVTTLIEHLLLKVGIEVDLPALGGLIP